MTAQSETAAPTTPVMNIVASVAYTVVGVLPSFLLGGLASLVREDLGFDEARLGLAVGAFYGASALTAIPGGRIGERLGARHGMGLGMLLAVAALAGTALSATSWGRLAGFVALGGAANAIIQSSAALALATGVPSERLGIAFGVKTSAIPAATLLAGLAIPTLGLTVGWRWAFAGGAVAAVALLGILPRDPRTPREQRAARVKLRRLVTRREVPALARLALASCCGAIASNSMGAFYVESLVHSGQDLAFAGALLSVGSIGGILLRLAAGWAVDRFGVDPQRLAGLLLLTGPVAYLMFGHAPGTGWAVLATLIGFGTGWGWPGLLQLAVVQDHMRAPAAASGIAHAGALSGGLIGPITFGWIVTSFGYPTAWTGVAVVALLAGGILLSERRTVPQRALA